MIDKHGSTPLLLNGQATCFIHLGRFEEADSALQVNSNLFRVTQLLLSLKECIAKDPNNAEALINMIVLSQHSGKAPEVANRYFIQLQESHRSHPYVKEYAAKEVEFDRLAAVFSAA